MACHRSHRIRRSLAAVATASVVGTALAACGVLSGPVAAEDEPVPAGPLGPIVQGQPGNPPIECRGVPLDSCRGFGTGSKDVVRIIVTCTGTCTPQRGDVRVDALRQDGTTESRGQGTYEDAGQPALPEPASTDGTY